MKTLTRLAALFGDLLVPAIIVAVVALMFWH